MKENNYNTCVVYLLNDIDKPIHLIEMFLVCLEISMKHPKILDVEMCWLRPVTSQCTKLSFPTVAMWMCEDSLVEWNVWIHRVSKENVSTMSTALMGRNFSSVDILLAFTLCQCNVMALLNNFSGTGAWFCNHLKTKPGDKTAAPPWPDPYRPYTLGCL